MSPLPLRGVLLRDVFLLFLCLYLFTWGGRLYSIDERIHFHLTQSLVDRGSFVVKPLGGLETFAVAPGQDGQLYTSKGIGLPLALIPFYLTAKVVSGLTPQPCGAEEMEMNPACLGVPVLTLLSIVVSAASGALLLETALQMGFRRRTALLLVLFYGVGTMAWVYASKSLFPEPLLGLALLGAFYASYRFAQGGGAQWAGVAGVALGYALWVKVPALGTVPFFLLYVALAAWSHRENQRSALGGLGLFLLGVGMFTGLWAYYNYYRFGVPWETGYGLEQGGTGQLPVFTALGQGLSGLFLAPGKSLFLYAPPAILALVAAPRFLRHYPREAVLVGSVFLVFLFTSAAWYDWGGGWSWGPRFLLPALPFLILPVGTVLPAEGRFGRGLSRWTVLGFLGVAAGVQLLGVLANYVDWYVVATNLGPPEFRDRVHELVFYRWEWNPLWGHWRLLQAGLVDLFWLHAARLFPWFSPFLSLILVELLILFLYVVTDLSRCLREEPAAAP